jgi:hypothetical protein
MLTSKTTGLLPIKLYVLMPGVLFLLEPTGNRVSDGSDFPPTLPSTFRVVFTAMLVKHRNKTHLEALRRASSRASFALSMEERCLYTFLRKGKSGGSSPTLWTRYHAGRYACKTCINMQRLCMIIRYNKIFVLPMHSLLGQGNTNGGTADEEMPQDENADVVDADVSPTKPGYWVLPKNI